MKKVILIISSVFLFTLFSTNVFAAGDAENIKKLSSFKRTDTVAGVVIPQNTQFAENVKKILFHKLNYRQVLKLSCLL